MLLNSVTKTGGGRARWLRKESSLQRRVNPMYTLSSCPQKTCLYSTSEDKPQSSGGRLGYFSGKKFPWKVTRYINTKNTHTVERINNTILKKKKIIEEFQRERERTHRRFCLKKKSE